MDTTKLLPPGIKYDGGKLQWHLLPFSPIIEVVRVLSVGTKKYEEDNWKYVSNARNRYFSASIRHITDWWGGEKLDPETGLHHLAHAVCCLVFLLWFDLENKK